MGVYFPYLVHILKYMHLKQKMNLLYWFISKVKDVCLPVYLCLYCLHYIYVKLLACNGVHVCKSVIFLSVYLHVCLSIIQKGLSPVHNLDMPLHISSNNHFYKRADYPSRSTNCWGSHRRRCTYKKKKKSFSFSFFSFVFTSSVWHDQCIGARLSYTFLLTYKTLFKIFK